jgi:hypothetical protein
MKISHDFLRELKNLIDQIVAAGGKDVLVAGGAIRDMLLERPIKDIDILYSGDLSVEFMKQTTGIGFEEGAEAYTNDDLTEDEQFSVVNWPEAESKYPVQLISCASPWDMVLTKFGCNLSKVILDSQGDLTITKQFMFDAELEILTFTEECVGTEYEKRIRAKYPTFL